MSRHQRSRAARVLWVAASACLLAVLARDLGLRSPVLPRVWDNAYYATEALAIAVCALRVVDCRPAERVARAGCREPEALLERAVAALTVPGEVVITCSHGVVRLPADCEDSVEALRLADQRMYGAKRARRRRREDITPETLVDYAR